MKKPRGKLLNLQNNILNDAEKNCNAVVHSTWLIYENYLESNDLEAEINKHTDISTR